MLEDFYTVTKKLMTEKGFDAKIVLNKEHLIYKAHFPGNPITPGVCILQICQELVAGHCGKPLYMTGAKNIKFLNVLNPLEHSEVVFTVEYNETEAGIKAMVNIHDEEKGFAKISAEYQIESE